MNEKQFNQMAAKYVEIGSWLSGCKDLTPEFLVAHVYMLTRAIDALKEDAEAIAAELRNHQA